MTREWEETRYILGYRYDLISFAGSRAVAQEVANAAAKTHTPTSFDAVGQGPVIVTATADIDLAAKLVAHDKLSNAGQHLPSINHIYCDPDIHSDFVETLAFWCDTFMAEIIVEHKMMEEAGFDSLADALARSRGTVGY